MANFSGAFIFGRHLEGMGTVGACLRQIGLLDTSVFTACDNIDEEFKIVKKTYHKTILQCVPALPAFRRRKRPIDVHAAPLVYRRQHRDQDGDPAALLMWFCTYCLPQAAP